MQNANFFNITHRAKVIEVTEMVHVGTVARWKYVILGIISTVNNFVNILSCITWLLNQWMNLLHPCLHCSYYFVWSPWNHKQGHSPIVAHDQIIAHYCTRAKTMPVWYYLMKMVSSYRLTSFDFEIWNYWISRLWRFCALFAHCVVGRKIIYNLQYLANG